MSHGWDIETESLRRELKQLPMKELWDLARQEGVRVAGRNPGEVIEALLRMEVEDGAGPTTNHGPGELAYYKGQPQTSRSHAAPISSHSDSWQQQTQQHKQHRQADSYNSPYLSAQHQQHSRQLQETHTTRSHTTKSATAAAAQAQHGPSFTGLSIPQQQQQQRRRSRHSNYDDLGIEGEASFTFAQHSTGIPAVRSSSTRRGSTQHAGRADDSSTSRYHTHRDHTADTTAMLSAQHSSSGSGGRASRRTSATPPPTGRASRQQQQLLLETKMQQLEQSLQKLQLSPRVAYTPPQDTSSSTGGVDAAGKTNRRLWSTPRSATSSQSLVPISSDPGATPSSVRRPTPQRSSGVSRPPSLNPELVATTSSRSTSRPRTATTPTAAASASRVLSATSLGSSRSVLADVAAPQRSAPGGLPASSRSPLPLQQQQQQHSRQLSLSPAPAKGAPRVGVMPCQKALLKKAAAEATKTSRSTGGRVLATSSDASLGSSSMRGCASSAGGLATPTTRSSSGAMSIAGRATASVSGSHLRGVGTASVPETPSRHRAAVASLAPSPAAVLAAATAAAAAAEANAARQSSSLPLSPGRWAPSSSSGSGSHNPGITAGVTAAAAAGGAAGSTRGSRRPQTSPSLYAHAPAASTAAATPTSTRRGTSLTGRITPSGTPPTSHRPLSARGLGGSSGSASSTGRGSVSLQQQHSSQQLSGTGAIAGRARQVLAASQALPSRQQQQQQQRQADLLGGGVTAGGPQLQQQQQQLSAAASKSSQLLHTPLRVRSSHGSSRPASSSHQDLQGGSGPSTPAPVRGSSRGAGAAATPAATTAAVAPSTPARQQVRAFGDLLGAAVGGERTTPLPRKKAPLAGTAAAAAAASGTDGPAVILNSMATPKGPVMGSARRVATSQARTALAAAAAAAQDTAAVADRGSSGGGGSGGGSGGTSGAGLPMTPLHKGARRLVPSDGGASDEVDKHLQALVERCLRIRNPEAHKLALQGPEPAKRWLLQHIISPWKRAGAASTSSSGGGTCVSAGFCNRSLLLHGPSGSGKTELVHALAAEMGANLLYVPGGESLLRTYQQEGHRLLRALFAVARRVAPCVVCFDDAHINFPSSLSRLSDAGGAAAVARMAVELEVQLQQLADMQEHLETAAAQQQHLTASTTALRRPQQSSSNGGSSGGGAAAATNESSSLRPVWGFFACKSKKPKKSSSSNSPELPARPSEQAHNSAYTKMPGPVVVVFVVQQPDSLDEGLLQQLPVQLLLDLPASDAREDLLMGWLMEREAAVNVQDVEWLARQTDGFNCNDLMQLCHQAALKPVQERSKRAVGMADLEVALRSMLPTLKQRQQQQQQQQRQHAQQQAGYSQQRSRDVQHH